MGTSANITQFPLESGPIQFWAHTGRVVPSMNHYPKLGNPSPTGLEARLADPLPLYRLGIVWAPMRAILGN